MGYLWADRKTIQSYLDVEGTIRIQVPYADLSDAKKEAERDSYKDGLADQAAQDAFDAMSDDEKDADVSPLYTYPREETFGDVPAQRYENESVYEIGTLLSLVFEANTLDAEYTPADDTDENRGDAIDTGVFSVTPLGFKLPVEETVVSVSGTPCPQYLCYLAAKLTSAKIGTIRMGSSLAQLPNWVRVYKNEVYSQIQRWALNASTATMKGLTPRSGVAVEDILIKMKTREQTAEDIER